VEKVVKLNDDEEEEEEAEKTEAEAEAEAEAEEVEETETNAAEDSREKMHTASRSNIHAKPCFW
jgi:hypothetical protein